MRYSSGFLALMVVLTLSGCVWTSEYKAKLAEIDGLQKNIAGLEDQNRSKDKDIAGLQQQVSDLTKQKEQLEKEKAGLQQENANIKSTLDRSRDQLTRDVVNLKSRVNENMARIGELEADLAAKGQDVDEAVLFAIARQESRFIADIVSSAGAQGATITYHPSLKKTPLLFENNRDSVLEGFGGAGIPIYSTDGILGVLMVQIESSRRVDDHINLLGTLAGIAGNAIHRADLFDQSQEQVRKLTTLRDIDSAIASSTDLRVTLIILMDHTLRHLKVDPVDILLYHSELQSLTYLCSAGFRSSSPTRPLTRIGEGLAGQVIMRGRIEQITELHNTIEFMMDPLLVREGFVSYIGIPLIVKGQIKGLLLCPAK